MKGGLTVIRVAEPLHTSKFTNADKIKGTVLNTNVTVSQVNGRYGRLDGQLPHTNIDFLNLR